MSDLAMPLLQAHTIAVRSVIGTTERGGAVFSGTTEDGALLKVVASHRALSRIPVKGEAWAVRGNVVLHPTHGRQLVATECRYEVPRGRLVVRFLADNPAFAGIGEGKAVALWTEFGDRLGEVLASRDADALRRVLSPTMADKLVAAWAEHLDEATIVEYLDRHGFAPRLANKLRRVWGDRTLEMLELNPYYLLALAGWRQVDSAAMKLGIARDDERRLVGAVESALYDRLQQSHTLSSHDDLVTAVNRRLKLRQADRAIQLALEEYAIVGSRESGYQTQGAAALERGVTERIRNMLAGESPEQSTLLSEPAGETWFERQIAGVESEQGFPLNLEQRLAAAMPFKNAFSVMTGGAGVGKTTVLRVIIRLAEAQHLNVFQMALAGRAAKRMAEASGREAMTIAKFLSMVRKGTLEVPADSIVIVDEASMLDLSSFYRVLRHLPDGVRLLLVGDAVQLPPISFGLVFHRLVGSKEVPQTHLLQVHRQAASTGIPAVASAVRAFEVPDIANFEGQSVGVSFVNCAGEQVIRMLEKLTAAWEDGDWQILAATKQGPCGINAINRAFHGIAASQNTDDLVQFQVGEPVIYLVNDYDRGLMNGTLGRVTAVRDGVGVTIDFEGGEHFFSSAELLDNVALAYAISVHKSQGSQFRRVIVVVAPSRILDHALVYTALTRGVEQVVFVGDRSSFERAVLSPPHAHLRQVGFVI